MGNWDNQLDVSHTLTANLLFSNSNTASFAHDTFVTDSLVLSAVAFVVLNRAEDALAEQTVALGLIGAVVDGFRFQHFTARHLENLIGRCKSYRNL